jgi:cytochrome P450
VPIERLTGARRETALRVTFPFPALPTLDHDPEAVALLAEGPVVLASMGPLDVWLALSYQAVRQVFADPRFSRQAASRPGGPVTTPVAANPVLISSLEGARHTRVRKLMGQAFSPRIVERLESRVQSIVDSLLDELDESAELVDALCSPLPTMVICELLGAPHADSADIRRMSKRLFRNTITPQDLAAAEQDMRDYLAELVRQKRATPDDALISAMVAANDEGDHLTETELLANLQGLLVAGHDTSVNQLGNCFVTLFRHPDQLQLLRDDPSLAGRAVEELMRYVKLVSSAQPRVTTEPVELAGVQLPQDAPVVPVLNAANRDPSVYPHPERLDLTRDGAPHVGFGHGAHFCLGAQLARLELRVAISTTIQRFPGLHLAVDPDELTYDTGSVLRSLDSLPVELQKG